MKSSYVKIFRIIRVVDFLIIIRYSSNDNEADLIPSQIITIEEEDGTKSITLENNHWRIASIINKTCGQRIFGEIFDEERKLVKENVLLKLDGLGKLDATWTNKGFNICRKTTNSLQIELYENATSEEFNFSMIIENEEEAKEILVNQKISEGYTFESIEYFLTENDNDDFFLNPTIEYIHDIPESIEIEIYPFSGADIMNASDFISDNGYNFFWFNENPPEVKVPTSIYEGKIYLSGNRKTYGKTTKYKYEGSEVVKEKVSIPAGKSKFHVTLKWCNRQVSYKIAMKNYRIGNYKTIEGKWLETTPTDKYTIIRDY